MNRLMHYLATVCIFLCQVVSGAVVVSHGGEIDSAYGAYTVINPRIFNGRTGREISLSDQNDIITIQFEYLNNTYVLDLVQNRDAVADGAVLRHQSNGSSIHESAALTEEDRCLYTGVVRHSEDSAVALSTCGHIDGMVYDRGRTMLIWAGAGSQHHLAVQPAPSTAPVTARPFQHRLTRSRRDAAPVRGPHSANAESRFLELVLVVDNAMYRAHGSHLATVRRRAKQIANIVNSLYSRLNIFVALVGLDVWTEMDDIAMSTNAADTLTNFMHYRRERLALEMPNDSSQLLTGYKFADGALGSAKRGTMCTYQFSAGVNADHSSQVSVVAVTVAQQLARGLGLEEDSEQCRCRARHCVMSSLSSSMAATQWSSCSRQQLALSFRRGLDHCLHNRPQTPLLDLPVCGNGLLEPGEQCDCGLPSDCDTSCCNPSTCQLRHNGTCATGECCDTETCRVHEAGVPCRAARDECDLAEYCGGQSEFCPADVYRVDGLPCSEGKSHCYSGQCGDRDAQCRLLWGPSGTNSAHQCYEQNVHGNSTGDCGFHRLDGSYKACRVDDVLCGRLHCRHLNERLEYGVESAATLSVAFKGDSDTVLPCRSAVIDLGLQERDPGLVPQGVSCGTGLMCRDQRCVPVSTTTAGTCPGGCGGRGVCNSLGHCHCQLGWAPPTCTEPGVGGSVDSGPFLYRDAPDTSTLLLYVVFLGVVPALLLLCCCFCYCRRHRDTLDRVCHWPSACHLPACHLPACRLPAYRLPTCRLPDFGSMRRKLGRTDSQRPVARSVRRSDEPKGSSKASYNIRLLVLSGDEEVLQSSPSPASRPTSCLLQPAVNGGAAPVPAATAPGPPGPVRTLLSRVVGRLTAAAGGAATPPAEHKLVCEVRPTVKPSGGEQQVPAGRPTSTAASGGQQTQPAATARATLGAKTGSRPSSPPAAPPEAADGADAAKRRTTGMAALARRPDDRPAAAAAGSVSASAGARHAFLSGAAAGEETTAAVAPARPAAGQVRFAADSFDKNAAEKKPSGSLEKKPSGVLNWKPSRLLEKKPGEAFEKKQNETLEKKRSSVGSTKAANALDTKNVGSKPNVRLIRTHTDSTEKRPEVKLTSSKPSAGEETAVSAGVVTSRSSTLESEHSDTLCSSGSERESALGSTLSRVASVFRRQESAGSSGSSQSSSHALRPAQSFKASKMDRDTVKTLGISHPMPQPPSQFSTLPTSPGRRGARPAVRAASDCAGAARQRPVSLLVRPSQPPPRPPGTALYDDCNADRRDVTPTDNIYCTIDEAPEEPRTRPFSLVEPATADALYQNTLPGRRVPWRSVSTREPTCAAAATAQTSGPGAAWAGVAAVRRSAGSASSATAVPSAKQSWAAAARSAAPVAASLQRPTATASAAKPAPVTAPSVQRGTAAAPSTTRSLASQVSAGQPTAPAPVSTPTTTVPVAKRPEPLASEPTAKTSTPTQKQPTPLTPSVKKSTPSAKQFTSTTPSSKPSATSALPTKRAASTVKCAPSSKQPTTPALSAASSRQSVSSASSSCRSSATSPSSDDATQAKKAGPRSATSAGKKVVSSVGKSVAAGKADRKKPGGAVSTTGAGKTSASGKASDKSADVGKTTGAGAAAGAGKAPVVGRTTTSCPAGKKTASYLSKKPAGAGSQGVSPARPAGRASSAAQTGESAGLGRAAGRRGGSSAGR